MKLEGKVAIVTGAGRGLGRGIALCLAGEGADIVVNSLHEETTNKTAADVRALGRRALAIAADATEGAQIARVVQEALNSFGKIDILVNNVGGASKRKEAKTGFFDEVISEWDGNYEQNLRSTVLMCTAVAPHFIKQKSGKIVNISSAAGRYSFTFPVITAYGAMKTALIRFTQSLANDLGPHNINANCICPGIIYTDAWKRNSKRAVETMPQFKGMDPREWFVGMMEGKYPELGAVSFTPLRREQTAEDIGRAVVFLVSEDAKNITGQALNVDGGMIKN